MKNFRIISKPISLYGILAFVLLAFASCQKSEVNPAGIPNNESDREISAARKLISRLPEIQIYDDKTKKTFRANADGFSFTDNTSSGFNFSDPQGVTYTDNNSGGQLVVSAQGFGINSSVGSGGSGGLISIGGRSINVKYTFCFSADDKFFGGNIFSSDTGGFNNGVSGVLGVDGDFSEFLNVDPNDDNDNDDEDNQIEDVFGGIGLYFVYDRKAQGTYPILNWIDLFENGSQSNFEADVKKKGFAYYIDFKNEKISLSKSGTLNVSGGTMNFTGKYLTFSDFKINNDSDDDNEPDDNNNSPFGRNSKTEDGLGSMGCN